MPLGDADPDQKRRELKELGIVCAARDGNLRLSVHLYNHEDDIERLAAALGQR